MPLPNSELLAKLQSICGDECESVTDEHVMFAGIAATGKKDSPERKECDFKFEKPTESLMMLAEKMPDLLAVAVRQMLTDARNKARQTLEGKGMPKYAAKVVTQLIQSAEYAEEVLELVEALGYTLEQYNEAK